MGMYSRSRRAKRRSQSGFSLIEAMVATGVLGIALAALVGLHTSAIRGTKAATRMGDAREVARGLADHFALRIADTPANCNPNINNVLAGVPANQCTTILATNAAAVCTSPQTCDGAFAGPGNCIADVDVFGITTAPPPGPPLATRYRVQMMESQNFGGDPGLRVTVIVCWNDADSGAVRTFTTSRLVVPGL